jgi:hypothetical protein
MRIGHAASAGCEKEGKSLFLNESAIVLEAPPFVMARPHRRRAAAPK